MQVATLSVLTPFRSSLEEARETIRRLRNENDRFVLSFSIQRAIPDQSVSFYVFYVFFWHFEAFNANTRPTSQGYPSSTKTELWVFWETQRNMLFHLMLPTFWCCIYHDEHLSSRLLITSDIASQWAQNWDCGPHHHHWGVKNKGEKVTCCWYYTCNCALAWLQPNKILSKMS